MGAGKPSLVLHPGLPKCATSAIQRAFVIQDHALAAELGVACIGKKFLPNNGYPAVSELMYDADTCYQQVLSNPYPPGRYFLSNEAVSGTPHMLTLLAQRFDIARIVVTVRFPPLQALSNYRFSGWLTSDLATAATEPEGGCYEASFTWFQLRLNRFTALQTDTVLCPTEPLPQPLLNRFCLASFGTVPALLAQKQYAEAPALNQSVSWAFAQALWQEVARVDPAVVRSWTRAHVVKAAQNYPLPGGMTDRRPPGDPVLDARRLRALLPQYLDLLLAHHLPAPDAQAAVTLASRELDRLLSAPVATEAEMQVFAAAAQHIIQGQLTAGELPQRGLASP